MLSYKTFYCHLFSPTRPMPNEPLIRIHELRHSFDPRIEERVRIVQEFLNRLAPHLNVCFFELQDPIGIAADTEEIQACVLTKETKKGGQMINEAR